MEFCQSGRVGTLKNESFASLRFHCFKMLPLFFTACPMGEVSSYLVAQNSYVRLPKGDKQSNYRVCKCGHHRMLSKCHDMERVDRDNCMLGSGRIHGN